MSDSRESLNPFFRLVIVVGGLFVITILALTASVFGDPQAPPVRFLDRHAGTILLGEVVLILLFGFIALAVDRRQTLREQREKEDSNSLIPQRQGPDDGSSVREPTLASDSEKNSSE